MTKYLLKKIIVPGVLGALLVTAGAANAQRGPGGGGWGGPTSGGGGFGGSGGSMRMGGGMNSDSSFDRLLQSYGGSGDTLDYSKIPADTRQRMDTFAKMTGGQPMPTSGTLSRAQYKVEFDTRMQAMQSRMGRGPGGPTAPAPATATAAAPSGTPQVVMVGSGGDTKTMTMTTTTTPGNSFAPGGGMGGPPMGGGRGGWGGGEDADSRFKQYDTNGDGKITKEELQANPRGSRLMGAFDQSDTNRDGSIDLPEYRTYYTAAMSGFGGGGGMPGGNMGGGGGGWGGGGGGGNPWNTMQDPNKQPPVEQEEEKPVIVRYGKLPSGMPEWFTAADTNRDAQISLFEYCRFFGSSTEQITEFKYYDLNGDSLLTAEEYLRYIKSKNSNGTPNLNGYSAPILANPTPGANQQRGPWGGPPAGGAPTPGFGPTPAGTTPTPAAPVMDNSRNKDRSKDKEEAPKSDSKDRGSRDRGDRGSKPSSSGESGGNPFNKGK